MICENRVISRLRLLSRAAAFLTVVMGLLFLAGWIFESSLLKGIDPHGISIKANAAVALLFSGASLLLLGAHRWRLRIAGQVLAVLVLIIGALTISQHLVGRNLGIDQLLFLEPPGEVGTLSPGRMGVPVSVAFICIGAALLLHGGAGQRRIIVMQLLAALAAIIALLSITGHAYDVQMLYGVARYFAIALYTAIGLGLMAIALLSAHPDRGLMATVCADNLGGVMARRLIVPAIVIPFILGWLRNLSREQEFLDAGLATAVMVVLIVIIFVMLIWSNAELLGRMARDRDSAERAQRALSERIINILENISQAFLSLDHEWHITYVNRRAEQLLQRSRDAILGRSIWELYPEAGNSQFHWESRRAVRDNVTISYEERWPKLGRWFESHLVPTEHGLSVFLQDITDRKAREEERRMLFESERAARAEAQRANRMKDEFLATLSHELRTPLNAILGWAQLLNTGALGPEETTQALQTIERNARLQAQMINDLLDVSRIISGNMRLEVQEIKPMAVIEAAIESVQLAAQAKGIDIHTHCDADVGTVAGDSARLQQVLWNLLSNSIKFTPRGGQIRVCVRREASDISIAVTDTGAGISPDFLPHVFDRFRQADPSTTRRYGGLGLGLAIVRHLTELHGGSVRVHSDGEGKGACFTVILPRAVEGQTLGRRAGGATALGYASAPAATQSHRLDDLRVLIVDDEPEARLLLRQILEQAGAHVFDAPSASAALSQLQHDPPDLLISDIGMPEQDGYELIRRVRAGAPESGSRVPAIALTAFARQEDEQRARVAGFDLHIPKPMDARQLVTLCAILTGRDLPGFSSRVPAAAS